MKNVGIILTTTVRYNFFKLRPKRFVHQTSFDDRLHYYLKSINSWLENSPFTVVLVENTGYKFPEIRQATREEHKDRFEIISFVESHEPSASYLLNDFSKGISELFAIQFAYRKSRLLNRCDFIIKITGRYFVPGLLEVLNNRGPISKWDGLRQNESIRCEIVGSSARNFPWVFNSYPFNEKGEYNRIVEEVYEWRMRMLDRVLVCPLFDIDPTPMGGIEVVRTQL